ncbi:MAG: hypothetical protein U5K69_07630 [Balneolaceae bacterium]|nr:hypothetical protein [Balneolaceae bacterium]
MAVSVNRESYSIHDVYDHMTRQGSTLTEGRGAGLLRRGDPGNHQHRTAGQLGGHPAGKYHAVDQRRI